MFATRMEVQESRYDELLAEQSSADNGLRELSAVRL